MSKVYKTQAKLVTRIHRGYEIEEVQEDPTEVTAKATKPKPPNDYSPINKDFFHDSDSEGDDPSYKPPPEQNTSTSSDESLTSEDPSDDEVFERSHTDKSRTSRFRRTNSEPRITRAKLQQNPWSAPTSPSQMQDYTEYTYYTFCVPGTVFREQSSKNS